jgi:nucleoside-diphosphate-sugar epimerase
LIRATNLESRKVLVTGGAGAIGTNLCRALLDRGAQVIVLDDFSSAYRWNVPTHPSLTVVAGSVTDDDALKSVFRQGPSLVFHLAALFANQNSIDNPERDLLVNGMGTLKVLQYSHLSGVERLIYASSGCSVYGHAPVPLVEDYNSLELDTPYQITKMVGECYCNFFKYYYDVQTVRCRFFNSFGPGEIPGAYRNVIPNFIYWAMSGRPLPVMGDGRQTRDWTFVEDIVDGLLRAAASPEAVGDAFNLASARETHVIDMAHAVLELTGGGAGIEYLPMRKWDTKKRLLASIDKARRVLGYEPQTGFRTGLERTVAWFRKNWEQIQRSAKF